MRSFISSRPHTLVAPALAAVLALTAGCASPNESQPDAMDATPHAAPAAADTVSDADGALWGDPVAGDAEELLAFLSEGTNGDAGNGTIAVSFQADAAPRTGHEVRALRMRNGKLLAGRLVSDDGATVEFEFETPDGVRGTTRVQYADIHPESVAELMLARADQQDVGALMEIAEYAAREGLYEVARVHYLAAAEQDPTVESIVQRRLLDMAVSVSEQELQRGSDAVEQGNDAVARRILRRVQREFAGTEAAEDAAAAIQQIDDRMAAKKLDATREKRLAPIRDLLADADELTGKGLEQAHKPSTAIRSYMASRSKATSARRKIPSARRAAEQSDDRELLGALDDLDARIDSQEVDNETQLATAYLDKGDLTRARQAANAVLALDGQNREALSLLGQIRAEEEERRASTYDAYWYRYRRRYGVYPYPRRWYPRRGIGWGSLRRGGTIRGGGGYTRSPIGVFRR